MKKTLIIALIFCLLFTVVLVSCPSETKIPVKDVNIQDSVKSSLIEIKNMYNTVPSESQSDYVNPPTNFYIEVGEIDNVENVKVGETLFTPTDKLKLSIGNNSFITQSVYKIEGGKLKIAAPVLQMELSSEYPDIRVDDKKVFRTDYVSGLSEMKPEGVYWHSNTTLGVPQLSDDKQSVTITIPAAGAQDIGKTMLGIDFKYNDGSTPQTPSFYFTKKTVNTVDGVKTYTYGTTGTDPINKGDTTEQMLAIYPYGWSTDNDFNTGLSEVAKYSKTMDYRVIGFVEEGDGIKAVASGRLLINLSKPIENVRIQDSIKSSLIEIKQLYNTVPSESQSDNVTPPTNFYIEVGKIDNAKNVKVGETSFTPTDMLKLSIGNNSFITQSVYKIEGGKLKIAAPVLQMELSSEYPDIRVDDKKVFRTDYVSGLSEMKPEGVYWHSNTTLGVPQLSDDKQSVTITIPAAGAQDIGKTMLGIDFKYNDGSTPQTPSFYFTKKTVNTVDGVKTYTYGTTGTDPINKGDTTEQMLAIYPYGWIKDDTNFNDGLSEAAQYSKTIDYRVIGFVEEGESIKAVASGRLLINLSKPQ